MSIAKRNARFGSTFTVYRPTVGDDSIAWGSAILTGIKLEVLPATDEIARRIFGAEARVEFTVLAQADIRKGDGLVATAGSYSGSRFRVAAAPPYAGFTEQFVELGLVATTEAIP
jgi:hypothetical protein